MRCYIDRSMWAYRSAATPKLQVSVRWLTFAAFMTWGTKATAGHSRRGWQVVLTAKSVWTEHTSYTGVEFSFSRCCGSSFDGSCFGPLANPHEMATGQAPQGKGKKDV